MRGSLAEVTLEGYGKATGKPRGERHGEATASTTFRALRKATGSHGEAMVLTTLRALSEAPGSHGEATEGGQGLGVDNFHGTHGISNSF